MLKQIAQWVCLDNTDLSQTTGTAAICCEPGSVGLDCACSWVKASAGAGEGEKIKKSRDRERGKCERKIRIKDAEKRYVAFWIGGGEKSDLKRIVTPTCPLHEQQC